MENTNKEFTVDYFIEKFSEIPSDKWRTGTLGQDDEDYHCALGWCGLRNYNKPTPESLALVELFGGNIDPKSSDDNKTEWYSVYNINDKRNGFSESTPKKNILDRLGELKIQDDFANNAKN